MAFTPWICDIGGDANMIRAYRGRTNELIEMFVCEKYDVRGNRLLIGYLYRELYNFLTAMEETGAMTDDSNAEFTFEELLQHVINPVLVVHSGIQHSTTYYDVVTWMRKICIKILDQEGWHPREKTLLDEKKQTKYFFPACPMDPDSGWRTGIAESVIKIGRLGPISSAAREITS
jgi:hypothetical protein